MASLLSAPNLFACSLVPFLIFLWYARRSQRFPPLAWWGFAATLVFVLVTVVAGGVAQLRFGQQLSDLVILRAADLQVQAVLRLPLAVPHGPHGSWSRRATTPATAAHHERP